MAASPNTESANGQRRPAAPRLFSLLKARWLFFSSLVAGGLLLLGALLYQARRDFEESRFATQRLTLSDPPIEILYRQHLAYQPLSQLGAPLIARLPDSLLKTSTNPTPSLLTIPLTFVSDHLMFTDAEGNPVSGQMLLSNENISQTVGTLYVRPKPVRANAPTIASLGIVVPPYTIEQPFDLTTDYNTRQAQPIVLETEAESHLRSFLSHLLGENALALAVGVALIGWGLDWMRRREERIENDRQFQLDQQKLQLDILGYERELKKEQTEALVREQAAKQEQERQATELRARELEREREHQLEERRRRLPPIREMMRNRPSYALQQFLALEEEAKQFGWDQSIRDSLVGFRADFEKDIQIKQHVIQHAGEAITSDARNDCAEILATYDEFFNASESLLHVPSRASIGVLRKELDANAPLDPDLPPQVHAAALVLWNEFNNYARELLRPLLIDVYRKAADPQTLLKQLEAAAPDLVRDLEIRRVLQKRGLESDFWDYNYAWSAKSFAGEIEDPENMKLWKNAAHLDCHPFGYGTVARDPLLLRDWANPTCWRTILANRPMILYASDVRDSMAVAVRLCEQIYATGKEPELKTVFPIWLPLPLEEMPSERSQTVYLNHIARACSNSWCELLAHNAEAFLDLGAAGRAAVAELLYWSSGSEGYLVSRLRQAGLKDTASGQILLRLLQQAIGVPHAIERLSANQLERWIALRPPGLKSTYLIASCANVDYVSQMGPFAEQLAEMSDLFSQCSVTLKLFTTAERISLLECHELKWSRQELAKHLGSRVHRATMAEFQSPGYKGTLRFADLFNPYDKAVNADRILARYAQGSLYRVLDMANAVVQARLTREISKEDQELERVLLDRSDLKNGLLEFVP